MYTLATTTPQLRVDLFAWVAWFAAVQLPDAADAEGRRALKRLQEVGVHVLAPAAELAAKPLPGGVAVMSLAEALAAGVNTCSAQQHSVLLSIMSGWALQMPFSA